MNGLNNFGNLKMAFVMSFGGIGATRWMLVERFVQFRLPGHTYAAHL